MKTHNPIESIDPGETSFETTMQKQVAINVLRERCTIVIGGACFWSHMQPQDRVFDFNEIDAYVRCDDARVIAISIVEALQKFSPQRTFRITPTGTGDRLTLRIDGRCQTIVEITACLDDEYYSIETESVDDCHSPLYGCMILSRAAMIHNLYFLIGNPSVACYRGGKDRARLHYLLQHTSSVEKVGEVGEGYNKHTITTAEREERNRADDLLHRLQMAQEEFGAVLTRKDELSRLQVLVDRIEGGEEDEEEQGEEEKGEQGEEEQEQGEEEEGSTDTIVASKIGGGEKGEGSTDTIIASKIEGGEETSHKKKNRKRHGKHKGSKNKHDDENNDEDTISFNVCKAVVVEEELIYERGKNDGYKEGRREHEVASAAAFSELSNSERRRHAAESATTAAIRKCSIAARQNRELKMILQLTVSELAARETSDAYHCAYIIPDIYDIPLIGRTIVGPSTRGVLVYFHDDESKTYNGLKTCVWDAQRGVEAAFSDAIRRVRENPLFASTRLCPGSTLCIRISGKTNVRIQKEKGEEEGKGGEEGKGKEETTTTYGPETTLRFTTTVTTGDICKALEVALVANEETLASIVARPFHNVPSEFIGTAQLDTTLCVHISYVAWLPRIRQ